MVLGLIGVGIAFSGNGNANVGSVCDFQCLRIGDALLIVNDGVLAIFIHDLCFYLFYLVIFIYVSIKRVFYFFFMHDLIYAYPFNSDLTFFFSTHHPNVYHVCHVSNVYS